jgi:hypothetical protein
MTFIDRVIAHADREPEAVAFRYRGLRGAARCSRAASW